MKTHTSDYKNGINKLGRQLKSKVVYTANGNSIELSNDKLNSITMSCETELLKSVMKYIEIDSNENIPVDTILSYELGLKVNGSYEYLNYGNYIVKEVENKEDTNSYLIKAYDKMLYAMKEYEAIGVEYPITIRDYLTALCNKLGLTFANESDEFPNYDKEIPNELYLSNEGTSLGYTFRDVLDELSQVTASNICINANDELELKYVNDTEDTIDETYLKDVNVKFGKTFGPVNTIVLSRAGGSDSIYDSDDESVETYGRCEIKIQENQIMNFNDRDTYIPAILEQLDGLEFSICDYESTGITYYDICDKYSISIGNETYSCLMLNDTIEVSQGLSESIYVKEPEETNTDYTKSDKTDNKINQTYIIANKQEGQIEALTSRVTTTEDGLRNTYTIDQVNTLIQNAETGVTNTFSEAGGNNIFRNTGLWFENNGDQNNPYEFWEGVVVRESEDKASNRNAMILQDTTLTQKQIVPNGNYTISFKYEKLLPLSTVSATINGVEYELDQEEASFVQTIEVSSQNIQIDFTSDLVGACKIYDLMVNAGTVSLAYSQNQNETTTDTVNISKGITITSSDTDTTFKANSDGIRTLDNSGNELAKFTDKGMTTKEMIVENKAQVTGLLFQQIGDQVWISKL